MTDQISPSLALDINKIGQGYGKDWIVQPHNNVTEWDIVLWCQWPDFPVGQHYKVTMNVHCHKSVHVLICCKDIKLPQRTR